MKHKPLARQLTAQFFRGNVPMFALAVFAALTGGTLNLIVTWLMQQLIDAASGLRARCPLGKLAWITGGFIMLCAALMLLQNTRRSRALSKRLPLRARESLFRVFRLTPVISNRFGIAAEVADVFADGFQLAEELRQLR